MNFNHIMSNYIIEDNMDFFTELKKSLNDKNNNKQELCLLSKQPLLKDQIFVLDCGHKFNYIPLFNEIKQQKCNKYYNSDIVKLRLTQIKCPYCRNVQEKILPFIKGFKGVTRVRGVTSPSEYEMSSDTCQYTFKSGKKRALACGKKCIGMLCISHKKHEGISSKSSKQALDINNIDLSETGLSRYLKTDLIKIAKHFSMKNYSSLKKTDLTLAIRELKK